MKINVPQKVNGIESSSIQLCMQMGFWANYPWCSPNEIGLKWKGTDDENEMHILKEWILIPLKFQPIIIWSRFSIPFNFFIFIRFIIGKKVEKVVATLAHSFCSPPAFYVGFLSQKL